MATGRIGVTPTLRTRWSKQPTAGTTSLSGLDDNSVALVYDVGYEAVYRNGALLSRGNDYTATNGTTVTLIDATLAGDIIEILANQLVPLADAISKGQFTAKGALLSATAASTPGVLAVGANDTVLTADSSTATGLKWATPAAGGMTLISETVASGLTSLSLSSIPQTYKQLMLVWGGIRHSDTTTGYQMRFNNTADYYGFNAQYNTDGTFSYDYGVGQYVTNQDRAPFGKNMGSSAGGYTPGAKGLLLIDNYASSSKFKFYRLEHSYGANNGNYIVVQTNGVYGDTTAITSIDIVAQTGTGTFSNATNTSIRLYGIS